MHTPGPWTVRFNEGKADTGANMEILDPTGIAIAVCYDDVQREEANARLMAAAPDLLDALNLALCDIELEGIELNHDTQTAIRAALALTTPSPTPEQE